MKLTIDARIADLQRIRRTLEGLIERCHGDHRPDCPILDELAELSICVSIHSPRDQSGSRLSLRESATINRKSKGANLALQTIAESTATSRHC
jgi:hypothetical protein